ncbi:MAG: DMT family transporter [Candidatus Limnocylindria bacterium]
MNEAETIPASEPIAVDWLALGAALTTVVLWASAFVGIRAVAEDLSPGALAVGRLIVGSVALGVVVALRRPAWPGRRDLAWIAAVGLVWFGAYNVTLNAAEQLVDAGTAAMLVNVGPILIALFAGLFLGEGFPPRLVAGSAIAFGGAIVIGLATSEGSAEAAVAIGIVLCLLAALAYAAGVTIQKPILGRVAALQVTWLACCVGALVTLPFLPQLAGELGDAPISAVGWLVYLGVFPTAIAFTTWAFALNRTTAGRLGSTTYLVPPVAILLAWLILGEAPPVIAFLGGALCIGGVIVARSKARTP